MAHFNIIQIYRDGENSKLDFNDFIDDPLIKTETYYVDDIAKGDQRKEAITRIKKVISPFADIDIDNETLTFHDKQTVDGQIQRHIKETINTFFENCEFEKSRLKKAIQKLSCEDLFFCNGYRQTLFLILIDYLDEKIPKTMHIGDIFNAHN